MQPPRRRSLRCSGPVMPRASDRAGRDSSRRRCRSLGLDQAATQPPAMSEPQAQQAESAAARNAGASSGASRDAAAGDAGASGTAGRGAAAPNARAASGASRDAAGRNAAGHAGASGTAGRGAAAPDARASSGASRRRSRRRCRNLRRRRSRRNSRQRPSRRWSRPRSSRRRRQSLPCKPWLKTSRCRATPNGPCLSKPSLGTRMDLPGAVFSTADGAAYRGVGRQFKTADGRAALAVYSQRNSQRDTPASYLRKNFVVPTHDRDLRADHARLLRGLGRSGKHDLLQPLQCLGHRRNAALLRPAVSGH